jgi:hypothetical protein
VQLRDCPQCGHTFGAVNAYCSCTRCNHRFTALPTQIFLAGKMGKTTDEQLLTLIAEYHEVPFLPSLDYCVSHQTAIMIGVKFARMNITIPLMVHGCERFVVVDPQAPELFEKIATTIHRLPEFAVASEHCIRKRINEHFGVMNPASTLDIQPLSPPK